MSDQPTTAAEARELAIEWAHGRRSHWNGILDMEARDSLGVAEGARQQSIVAAAQADAAEVARWGALATTLLAFEQAAHAREARDAIVQSAVMGLR